MRRSVVPAWVRWLLAGIAAVALAGLGLLVYSSLDALYPQPVWRYFRPEPTMANGAILYRTSDGHLYLAPAHDVTQARRLLDPAATDGREYVRDASVLPDGKTIAYFATERPSGQPERDVIKLLPLDGGAPRSIPILVGESLRPALFASTSGRYLALTSRDRTRTYFLDTAGSGELTAGAAEQPPERMLWTRNADSHSAALPGQAANATSADGKQRAQLRPGQRRAPSCDEPRCEAVQELAVGPAGVAAAAERGVAVVYGAFASFSAEGWGPVPSQPAQRIYGRLVWSPDSAQLLFSTQDGEDIHTFVIGADGRTRPRLVLEDGEALDWIALPRLQ